MEAAGVAVCNTVTASDAELVSWARDGDDAAFGELFRRYRPRVAAFVRGIVRDEGRAEDVTQEAFLAALRRLRDTDREIDFKPWIFQIARNASIDVCRRRTRTEEISIDLDGGLPAVEAERIPGHALPASSLIDKERLDHLRGALAELSESHHRIIVLRELEGLSYREIAERMELTPAAVESTLFRARRKLEHEYVQIDTGRRCQSIAALIARLAEGLESGRDRRRLDRHARRCPSCRRRARELGVQPVLPRRGPASRVAALLPVPALFRRGEGLDLSQHGVGAGMQGAAPLQGLAAPAIEPGINIGKAAAAVAAAALIGGGGATLGGGSAADGDARVAPAIAAPAQSSTKLLPAEGIGRPFPQPPARERSARAGAKARNPHGRGDPDRSRTTIRSAPSVVPAPAAPTVPRPEAKGPGLKTPGTAIPRDQLRLPSVTTGGPSGAVPKVDLGSLSPADVKAVLHKTAANVSTLLTPPS